MQLLRLSVDTELCDQNLLIININVIHTLSLLIEYHEPILRKSQGEIVAESINLMKQSKKQGKEQNEFKVCQGIPAERVLLYSSYLGTIDESKKKLVLSYVKEIIIGQSVKLNENIILSICGVKQCFTILNIVPQHSEQSVIVDVKTTIEVEGENPIMNKRTQNKKQKNLLYEQSVLDDLDSILRQTLQELNQKILENQLPTLKGLLITGTFGTGKSLLLQIIQEKYSQLKPVLIEVNHSDFNIKELQAQFSRAIEGSMLILFDGFEQFQDEGQIQLKGLMIKFFQDISDKETMIIATATSSKIVPDQLRKTGRFEREITLELPNHEKRAFVLEAEFKVIGITINNEVLKEISYSLSGFTINDLRCLVREFLLVEGNYEESLKLKLALQRLNTGGLKDVQIDIPKVDWSEIGGYESVKEEIKRVIEWPLKYPQQLKKLGIAPSKGILLYGPPGCSKTLLARALCTQCNFNFIAVKGPEIFSKYVGDSERTIREIFKKARMYAPSIIFFDEIDAIAPQRQGSTDVSDRVLIQLLTEMDGFESLKNVIIVGATNRPASIDKALLRPGRFDHLIFVDVPDAKGRKAILEVNLKKMQVANEVLEALSYIVEKTVGYTGAEICQLCREAGIEALSRNIEAAQIELQDFERAYLKVKPSVTEADLQQFKIYARNQLG